MRGNGWGKKHSTVNYVFKYDIAYLIAYHKLVMDEMFKRNYNVDPLWLSINYRGKKAEQINDDNGKLQSLVTYLYNNALNGKVIYPEHNDEYLQECLDNLLAKNVIIDMNKNIKEVN